MNLRIDPDLKYCPQCEDEYRADIINCASCNIELLTGRQIVEIEKQKQAGLADRSMEILPGDEVVDMLKGSIIDIKQRQALLKKEGFPSLLVNDDKSCGKGCCGTDVFLRVRMADVQEIQEVLARQHIRTTGLADHDTSHAGSVFNTGAEKVTCPACGFTFSTKSSTCPDCGLCF